MDSRDLAEFFNSVVFAGMGWPLVWQHGCSTLWNVEEVKEVIDATDGSAEAVLRE